MNEDKLTAALNLWVKDITGVDPEANFNSQTCSFETYEANRDIKKALEIDPSHLLSLLLLDYYSDRKFKITQYSLQEMLENPDTVRNHIAACKSLKTLLADPELAGLVQAVKEAFSKIQVEYNLDPESLKVFDDRTTLTFLYRDCLWSLEQLKLLKFSLPPTADCPTNEPKLVKSVHEFTTPSDLVNFMSNSTNCIVVGYFPNPTVGLEYSAFAFAFRRGREVFLLSDLPDWAHPLQECMTRKAHPDRALDERTGSAHFPYYTLAELHEIKENEEIKSLVTRGQPSTFPKTLGYLHQLDPIEAYWAAFVAGLIKKKFYTEHYNGGEEAVIGSKLIELPLLESGGGTSELSPVETIHRAVEAGLCGEHPHDQYDWIQKKYQSAVEPSLLFLTEYSDTGLLAPGREVTLLPPGTSSETALASTKSDHEVRLRVFNTGVVGNPEKLQADRLFLARYNESKMVMKAAYDDFQATHEAVYNWYAEAVKKNKEKLLESIARLEMLVEGGTFKPKGPTKFLDHQATFDIPVSSGNILTVYDEKAEKAGCHHEHSGVSVFEFGGVPYKLEHGPLLLFSSFSQKHGRLCYLTGERASIKATFYPKTGKALAALAGVKFEEIPEVLQHWRPLERYTGNSILDRIDPMEWAIDNPWRRGIDFDVEMSLSRNAFNSLRRKYNLEPLKFWNLTKEEILEREKWREEERRERWRR